MAEDDTPRDSSNSSICILAKVMIALTKRQQQSKASNLPVWTKATVNSFDANRCYFSLPGFTCKGSAST
jgi:hypothetical protein